MPAKWKSTDAGTLGLHSHVLSVMLISNAPAMVGAPVRSRDMSEPHPSIIKRFSARFRAKAQASPPEPNPRAIIHDLNNILGIIIGCFDEQIDELDKPGELNRVKLRQLSEDGLAAALRGAALTRHRPDPSGG
jgi:hypothetical protein